MHLLFSWLNEALWTFWMRQPALDGAWRIYLYGGLLVLALTSARHSPPYGDSPLQAPEVVSRSHADFYEHQGFMRCFGALATNGPLLVSARAVLVAAWVACLIGFGGRGAALLVALTAFFLQGAMSGALGTNHRWVIPLGVLGAAPLVDLNATLSVDGWLAPLIPGYPFPPGAGAEVPSGFLRQLALLIAVFTLFAGGISKLRLGGLRWLDGESLRYFVSRPRVGAWPALKRFLYDHPAACKGLAVATVALELGCVTALFVPDLRVPVLLAAALFHLGIWLTMNPNYLPQTWCYALCLGGASATTAYRPTLGAWPLAVVYGSTLLGLGLVLVACRGIERWPLTCIPMYAFYRGPADEWSHDAIHDDAHAFQLGREYVASRLPYPLAWSENWVRLQIVTGDGHVRIFRPQGLLPKHWSRLLHRAVALQFADDASRAPQAFLEAHRGVLLDSCDTAELNSDGCQVQFVCRVAERDRILGVLIA